MLKEAFNIYFEKLLMYYKEKYDSLPKVLYNDYLDSNLVSKETINNGFVVWEPKLQEEIITHHELNSMLNFIVRIDIYEFFTTYYFLLLKGALGAIDIKLIPITALPKNEFLLKINKLVYESIEDDSKYFLIGSASIEDINSYCIFADNESGAIYCINFIDDSKIKLASSINELISNIKPNI